jgi:hypothetical protein
MLTCPPENRLAKMPRLTEARISSGECGPGRRLVLVMRGIGMQRNDSRRPLPDGSTPKCRADSRSCM